MAGFLSPTAKIFYDLLLTSGPDWKSASDLGLPKMMGRVHNELLAKDLIEQSWREGAASYVRPKKTDANYDNSKSPGANVLLARHRSWADNNMYRIIQKNIPVDYVINSSSKSKPDKIAKAISFLEKNGYRITKK